MAASANAHGQNKSEAVRQQRSDKKKKKEEQAAKKKKKKKEERLAEKEGAGRYRFDCFLVLSFRMQQIRHIYPR